MSPPAWRKEPDRKSARDAYKREQAEAAKKSMDRHEEAKRKAAEKEEEEGK